MFIQDLFQCNDIKYLPTVRHLVEIFHDTAQGIRKSHVTIFVLAINIFLQKLS